jgi:hypothetical protein
MRFDPARAIRRIADLATRDVRGQEAGTDLAGCVAADLKASGWEVENREVLGSASASGLRRWLGYVGYGLGVTAAFLLALHGSPIPWRVLAWGLAVAWWTALANYAPRHPWSIPPLKPARVVLARRRSDVSPATRVLIQAAMGPIEGRSGRSPYTWIDSGLTWLSPTLLAVTIFGPGAEPAGPWASLQAIGWVLLAGVWGVILLGLAMRLLNAPADIGQPDTAALAFLLELGRTWPKGHSDRVETILAVVGGQELDRAGDHALRLMMKTEWHLKPTLSLSLVAPGAGKELLIVGSDVVRQAAAGLWVPHRVGGQADIPEGVRPLDREQGATAVLAGADWSQRPPPPVDPEALGRTAQLVTETALRWARQQHGPAAQRPDDRNDARSSQNPG